MNYVRGLLRNVHEPVSLEQMRKSLSNASRLGAQSGGPPLKETLDWLKEKIPLATAQYVRSYKVNGMPITGSVSLQGTATSVDSCTVVVGEIEVDTPLEHLELHPLVATDLWTVPLTALIGWTVEHRENEEDPEFQFVSGERWSYRLFLTSNANEIYRVLSFSAPSIPANTASMNRLNIIFNDESLARRVAQAFHHASDLCRKGEAF